MKTQTQTNELLKNSFPNIQLSSGTNLHDMIEVRNKLNKIISEAKNSEDFPYEGELCARHLMHGVLLIKNLLNNTNKSKKENAVETIEIVDSFFELFRFTSKEDEDPEKIHGGD